ncbi:MAG: A/G-specific adenine glycosylase [Chloroflexi bacterium]|nr:A/G-specific adenine glycosylase [Chloroflexota bacterium]
MSSRDGVGATAPWLRRRVLAWYRAHGRGFPWRETRDPYAILVSEVMLQQTQTSRVVPSYQRFLQRFPTFERLAQAPLSEVIRAWSGLGYNRRAVWLHRIAQEVMERGGRLPRTPAGMRRLPGIGDYTANAVACFAFGAQAPVVDTNVRRVLARVFRDEVAPTASGLRDLARDVLPRGKASLWNQALMDLGATVCITRAPRCAVCPLQEQCRAAPVLAGAGRRVAEPPPLYRAQPAFRGSTRFYRGRIIQRLRQLWDGQSLPLKEVGEAVRPGFSRGDMPWLERLAQGLERDGLAQVTPEGVRLPYGTDRQVMSGTSPTRSLYKPWPGICHKATRTKRP